MSVAMVLSAMGCTMLLDVLRHLAELMSSIDLAFCRLATEDVKRRSKMDPETRSPPAAGFPPCRQRLPTGWMLEFADFNL